MTTAPFATTSDVANRWRPLTPEEESVAEALLDDASAKIVALVPTLTGALADGLLAPELVLAIVAASVIRVLRNPDGWQQEAIDDYSRTRDSVLSSGLLDFTDDELGLLRGSTAAPRVRTAWLV